MFFHCELVVLILALTLNGQVHTGEIYGGHEAKPHSRPYMVLLERHMQNGQTSYCGGFLLNKYFVMTAAHCQAKSYTALLGVHNACNCAGVQRIPVKAAFPHKDYNETEYTNDIMLLKKKVYCSEGKAGPAEGDSGGPLVCKDGKAYGVVGTSFQSNPEIYPYAKIPENADWINWITGNNEKF
ncbi:granzyme B(G,H)-like isoform X2 [Lates calcarifer]|uniref:trypsin n=1 Tax=Lates calcarifer TaxID=8187 RepID=A0AAJ8BI35_LATCA|nr:granzyme B(G,H)-like isoform X2 [Lates calcarifer]